MSCQCSVSGMSVNCQCNASVVHLTLHWQSKSMCDVYVFKTLLWYLCDVMAWSWQCHDIAMTMSWQCNFLLWWSLHFLYKGSVGYWNMSRHTCLQVYWRNNSHNWSKKRWFFTATRCHCSLVIICPWFKQLLAPQNWLHLVLRAQFRGTFQFIYQWIRLRITLSACVVALFQGYLSIYHSSPLTIFDIQTWYVCETL